MRSDRSTDELCRPAAALVMQDACGRTTRMPALGKLLSRVWAGSDEVMHIATASLTAVGAAVSSLRSRGLKIKSRQLPLFDTIESDQFVTSGPWTAQRLRDVLRTQLQGERVIVVANREPLIHEWARDEVVTRHPASGLVTALEPVMRACSGVWVAHGSGSADRASSDRHGRVTIGSAESSYLLRRVWLTEEEEQGYYYGFSNEALWPLCHLAHAHPIFRRADWLQYQKINQRFADAVVAEADCDDPIVLVQDYHFALVPKMLRRAAAARDDPDLLAHSLAERGAAQHLPVPERHSGRSAGQQHGRLPDAAALSQLPRLRRPERRGSGRAAGTGRRASVAAHARARRTRSRSSGRASGRRRRRPPTSAARRSANDSRCRRRRGSSSRSIASTTRRGSKSGC